VCGIAGFATTDPSSVGRADLLAMSEALAHRGPDDSGFYEEGGIGLAQRRLAILDLTSAGHQPMQGSGGTWLVHNGEVYNFLEIAGELRAHGPTMRTRCDTELILLAIEQWGLDQALKRFNGMFAFAHWDPRSRTMTLVRDRLGVKPLYYCLAGRSLVFASELRALQQWSDCPTEIDPESLDLYLSYEYVPAPRTILRNVRKLEPGTLLQWRDGSVSVRHWWDLHYQEDDDPRTDDEWADELHAALRRATLLRLVSDVPLGALLSGGVDSSAVVALMAELEHTPKTFSIGFEDSTYNELDHARRVADHVGADHHEETLRADPALAVSIAEVAIDEPLADVSVLPTYLVSRMARQHVTVALSGDGGDEVFGGYDWYRAADLADAYARVPGPVRVAIDRALTAVAPTRRKRGLVNTIKRFSEGAARDARLEQLRWQLFADARLKRALYATQLKPLASSGRAEHLGIDLLSAAPATDSLSRRQWVDIHLYLPDDILTKVDRASMAVALEVRSPFLDVDVVELSARLPPRLRVKNSARKVILKRAVEGLVPASTLRRRKEGFSVPMKQWLGSELQPLLRDTLLSPNAAEWFDQQTCARLIDEHVAGSHNHAHILWALLVFELFRHRARRTVATTAASVSSTSRAAGAGAQR
jgi:asparagine synthase (glutamine-hydrolysing)